jgi:hypothetical protein
MGRGRDPDIIPFRGPANLSRMAERAGFEYHPLSGARKPIQNGGEGGIRISSPFGGPQTYPEWRRGRDSNPRTFVGYTLSKRAR